MEEEVLKRSNKSANFFKSTFGIIIMGLLVAIIILFGIYFLFFNKDNSDNTYKIAKDISKSFNSVRLVNEPKDNSLKYGCQHATLIYLDSEYGINSDESVIDIARYMNSTEAKLRVEFLVNSYKLVHDKFDNTFFAELDEYKKLIEHEKDIIYSNGVYLIRINSKLSNASEIKNNIDSIITKYNVEDIPTASYNEIKQYWDDQTKKSFDEFDSEYNKMLEEFEKSVIQDVDKMSKCVNDECDSLLNEYKKLEKFDDFKNGVSKIIEAYNNVINEKKKIVSLINSSISKLKKSLNESEYDSTKNEINKLNDTYYNSYKSEWNSQLKSVETDIYKKSCKTYSYKDLLRYPDKYNGQKAYFFGEIVQKVSSTQYRVDVNCKKYQYIGGYSCNDTIYMYYYGDLNLLEDDMIKVWGTMEGTETYTSIWNTTITIPKFRAKYASISK